MSGVSRLRACAGLALMMMLVVSLAPASVAGATPTAAEDAELYALVVAALPPGTHRAAPRLAQASVDAAGEATVIFAIRAENGDADATRAGGVADALTALRTIYASPAAAEVTSLTVLGTFPFQGTKGRAVREGVVLRAVLSAEHAAQLDWDHVSVDDLDVWWMQEAFGRAESTLDGS
jgi:hypothetical protein